jgi:hypothetical protein
VKPRIYIAGPMTGYPESNYPAFNAAAATWRAMGWDVENPAEHFGGAQDRTYEEYVEADIVQIKTCDAMAMLPAWNAGHSGAIWERAIARHLLNIPVFDATSPCKPDVLDHIDGGAEILVANYDEWCEFKRWKQAQQITLEEWQKKLVRPEVAAFVDLVLNPAVPPSDEVPITRHLITGALGRWVR